VAALGLAADKSQAESPATLLARQHVAAALAAEARGENELRSERLAAALAASPDLAEAQWHSARVRVGDEWITMTEDERRTSDDPLRAEYQQLRSAAANPSLLRSLARWCAKAGWDDRSRLHYAQLLLRGDTNADARHEAIKNLNLHYVGGNWITGDELAAQQDEAKAADLALRKHRPRMKRLQQVIDGDNYVQRDRAIEQLASYTDPEVIPVLESFLLDGGDEFQLQAVRRLATFPQYLATKALVQYAVLAESVVVRDEASQALQPRPLHEHVPLLLGGLSAALKSQYEVKRLPNGAVAYSHALIREMPEQRNIAIANHVVQPNMVPRRFRFRLPPGRRGEILGVIYDDSIWLDQKLAAAGAEARAERVQLAADLASQPHDRQNRRVFKALAAVTEQSLPDKPSAWWNWWESYNEYEWPKPTYYSYTSESSQYYTRPPVQVIRRTSCFFAGTPVRTETGLAPIESIQPGDRVLAQDQDTGELAYQVVLRTTLRPPSAMVRIAVGGESIITTLGHPFWVAGQGWKMAKQLAVGDLLHGLHGAAPIETVAPLDGKLQAHNLVVADSNTYFVGQSGLLVHDNEFRRPTRAIVPGLIAEEGTLTAK